MCDRITYQNDHKYFETIFGFLDALEIQIGGFFYLNINHKIGELK